MLICDILLEVRASRSLSAEQVARIERIVLADSDPSREALEAISVIDAYARRRHPSWAAFLARLAERSRPEARAA